MTALQGARFEPISNSDLEQILNWVTGKGAEVPTATGARWLLAHTLEGVTWGVLDAGAWELSSLYFPKVSPPLERQILQEVRLFGPEREVLIWSDGAALRGRVLWDTSDEQLEPELSPLNEQQLLLGDRVLEESSGPFTLIGDATGSRHAVPLRLTSKDIGRHVRVVLDVRHYLVRDEESGAVRITASRLVDVSRREFRG